MKTEISREFLIQGGACQEVIDWFTSQDETDGIEVVKKLITDEKLNWANELIVQLMARSQYISYAIFAAEQVLDFFETRLPGDRRPRAAIKAAKNCLADEAASTTRAAIRAAVEAESAARAAWAAWTASTAGEAVGAEYAASAAAGAAWAADCMLEAAKAASEAGEAARAIGGVKASAAMQRKILTYGLELFK